MRTLSLITSLGLGAAVLLAATVSPAAAPKMAHMASGSPADIAKGHALSNKLQCNTCHGANLAGKKGFSPSLHTTGVLKEYNVKTFARVMNTGVTNDNGHVKAPMPVYHLPAAKSATLYAYLKTLK